MPASNRRLVVAAKSRPVNGVCTLMQSSKVRHTNTIVSTEEKGV